MSDVLNALARADVALFIGALVVLTAYILLNVIARVRRAHANPAVDDILTALTPWLYRAIIAGERAALFGLREADAVLTGADKAAIANSLYALLPDTIMVGVIPVPVSRIKALVPRYLFAEWVKEAYDATHAFLLRNEDFLQARIDKILPAAEPDGAVTESQQRAA